MKHLPTSPPTHTTSDSHTTPQQIPKAQLKPKDSFQYERAVNSYESRFGRRIPPGYKAWFEYAQKHECLIEDSVYDGLETQLKPFREYVLRQNGAVNFASLVNEAKDLYAVSWIDLDLKGKKCRVKGEDDLFGQTYCSGLFDDFLGELVDDEPGILEGLKGFKDGEDVVIGMVMNVLDEPRILYPTVGKGVDDNNAKWTSRNPSAMDPSERLSLLQTACKDNPLVRQNVKYHGFLAKPTTLEITTSLLPVFSYGHIPGCFADIIIPSIYAIQELRDFTDEPEPILPPWSERIPKLLWRGSTTSTALTTTNITEWLETNHRIRFVKRVAEYSSNNPNLFDVGFTGIAQPASEEIHSFAKTNLPLAQPISRPDHYKYKYLFDMDGNGGSGRFIHFLKDSSSLIIRSKVFSEWFDSFILPGEHYFKTGFDYADTSFRDILSILQWAKEHDDQVAEMAAKTSAFAKKTLRLEDMRCFMFRVFIEYLALFRL